MANIFNPDNQSKSLDNKIVIALERISEAFKAMLWEQSKAHALSPIQIQVLIFVHNHEPEFAKVSYLSEEFNVTKATMSDTIKTLEKKSFITKEPDFNDQRSYQIKLTSKGIDVALSISNYPLPLVKAVKYLDPEEKTDTYNSLIALLNHLNNSGVINVNRMCHSCKFLQKGEKDYYCNFLEKTLKKEDLRIDCPEHSVKIN